VVQVLLDEVEVQFDDEEHEVSVEMEKRIELNIVIGEVLKNLVLIKVILCLEMKIFLILMMVVGLVLDLVH
jgi:hypothetical protein